jgi:putative redox protein
MRVSARSVGGYKVEISAGVHTFLTDEPAGIGDDAGPGPYDLLLSALAGCKIMTVLMYARRKEWPLEGVEVKLSTSRMHARDCEDCESDPSALIDLIEVDISFEGQLEADQVSRLAEIADRCPVHRTLTSETVIRSRVV